MNRVPHPYRRLHRREGWVEEIIGLERSYLYRKMKALGIHLGE